MYRQFIRTIFFIAILSLAGNLKAVTLGYAPAADDPGRSSDSAQPDTVQYDNGGYYYMFGPTNLWGYVRFTVPAEFELRCIYLQMYNPNADYGDVTVYVKADDSGEPGETIAGPIIDEGPNWINGDWLDIDLETPYPAFSAGEDFYIVFGPAPGGYPEEGWFLYVDADGNSDGRSAYGTSEAGPWNSDLPGDLIIRAGGILSNYVDLSAEACFSESGRFFIPEESDVQLNARIRNQGSLPVFSYDVTWIITDQSAQSVFESTDSFGPLGLNAESTVSCPDLWHPANSGYYTVEAVITALDDANPDNDTVSLEQGVSLSGQYWYSFDDGEWDANVTLPLGMGWGQRFNPAAELVRIDSVQIAVAGDLSSSDVRLVQFNGMITAEVWNYNGPLWQGVNTIDLTNENVQIGGDGIGLGYFYQDGGAIYRDSDAPLAGSNLYMEAVSYQLSGAAWTPVDNGDWGLRIFCTDIIAVEPEVILNLFNGFQLLGNYPNPFNSSTAISIQQPAFGKVSLSVYDVEGRLVETLDQGWLTTGVHKILFNAGSLPSGVYLYQVFFSDVQASGRMVLIK